MNALDHEAKTWLIEDPEKRAEKIERERIRYPYIFKRLGLHHLDWSGKRVLDVGGGPIGMSDLFPDSDYVNLDPLHDEYSRFFPSPCRIKGEGEKIPFPNEHFHLCLSINSLDHCRDPEAVIREIIRVLRYSGYFAALFCINNALLNPHPAHVHNIDERQFLSWISRDFETVWLESWSRDRARYGWKSYGGRVGQPALYWLGRKVH
jgi:SAM-dependent methyltransferase